METYFDQLSKNIHSQYYQILQNACHTLKRNGWKEGTRPQDKQLQATHDASTQIDDLYSSLIETHIKVTRKVNYTCPYLKDIVNGIQLYRKKGILELLKSYDKTLGKVVTSFPRRSTIPDSGKMKHIRNNLYLHPDGEIVDNDYGIYGIDWHWAAAGTMIGKINTGLTWPTRSEFKILEPTQYIGGHAYLEQAQIQDRFNSTLSLIWERQINGFPDTGKQTKAAAQKSSANIPSLTNKTGRVSTEQNQIKLSTGSGGVGIRLGGSDSNTTNDSGTTYPTANTDGLFEYRVPTGTTGYQMFYQPSEVEQAIPPQAKAPEPTTESKSTVERFNKEVSDRLSSQNEKVQEELKKKDGESSGEENKVPIHNNWWDADNIAELPKSKSFFDYKKEQKKKQDG